MWRICSGTLFLDLTMTQRTSSEKGVLPMLGNMALVTTKWTSSSVKASFPSGKIKPLRVVTKEEGGGVKGMNRYVASGEEMKH